MKRSIMICLAIGLTLAMASVAMAGLAAGTGISGTKHDLSTGGQSHAYAAATDTKDRICIYCHTPHHAAQAADFTGAANTADKYFPLWNHDITTQTYATYTNGSQPNSTQQQANSLEAGALQAIGSVSRLCLSCHDGSVAVSAYGNFGNNPSKGDNTQSMVGGGATGRDANRIGYDGAAYSLANHHPIGFDYAYVVAQDDEINPPDTTLLGANTYGLTINDLLWNGRMECSSCHDVHNTKNEGSKFTWVEDTQSHLCLTCHNK